MLRLYVSIISELFLIILMSTPAPCSPLDHGHDIPDARLELFQGKRSDSSYTVNFREAYRDAPLLGVLYVPPTTPEREFFLRAFFSNFKTRDKVIEKEEMVSGISQYLFLTLRPSQTLLACLEEMKPARHFLLATDYNALLRAQSLNSHGISFLLFRFGRLLWKETIDKVEDIPYF
jgi:hypothetical protein